jgi:hypothetical protein
MSGNKVAELLMAVAVQVWVGLLKTVPKHWRYLWSLWQQVASVSLRSPGA